MKRVVYIYELRPIHMRDVYAHEKKCIYRWYAAFVAAQPHNTVCSQTDLYVLEKEIYIYVEKKCIYRWYTALVVAPPHNILWSKRDLFILGKRPVYT